MSIKITIPNSSSDVLTFGSGNTPTAAQIAGIDSGSSNGQMAFYTTATGTSTERMRIDSSGNVGVGVTPSAWSLLKALQIQNAAFAGYGNTTYVGSNAYFDGANFKYISTAAATLYTLSNSAGQHQWSTAASGTAGNTISFNQAMTLDASGNLLVGTTSSSARLTSLGASTTSANIALYAGNSSGQDLFYARCDGLINTGTRTVSPYNNTTASAANMFVNSSGDLLRSTSSLKYKTNVQDATHGLNELITLRPVTYEGKAESDAGKTFGGLIAEEVHEAGLTEFVQYAEDGSPDALAYGNMVSLCIKAIQEQQAIITSLTDRITALENK